MSSFKENFEEKKDALKEGYEETKENISESIESGVKKTKSFFKKVLIYSLIGLVVSGGVYLLWSNWTYSEGTRTGYLMKISTKGYVFKTHEGQLNLGGFQESDNTSIIGNIWDFSLTDEELLRNLEVLEGKKVMLRYKEINNSMPWQGDTNYYIYAVEER
ncbi:MAG: hypothetical protein ACI8P3_002339 [Saprospiraceae bacterium]|jgi:hypothetical protein